MILPPFPPGTEFFSDDGDPIAMLPGGKLLNCGGGSSGEMQASEFGHGRPPMPLSEAEFFERVKLSEEGSAERDRAILAAKAAKFSGPEKVR